MKRLFLLILTLTFAFCAAARAEHTREDVREAYAEFIAGEDLPPFASAPRLTEPVAAGVLTEDAIDSALGYVNFFRYLAYLDSDVTLDELYGLRAGHAAALLAINGALEHDAPKPDRVSEDFYETAHSGTMASNIVSMNWFENGILDTAIEYFARDDGEANLEHLGHRRWLLNPRMAKTGFGLAVSDIGISYAAMYAQDMSREIDGFGSVKWPSEGAFPADLMSYELAWSVTLDPAAYDAARGDVRVKLSEKTLGDVPLKSVRLDTANYGAGACVIFLPDFSGIDEPGYWQNQVWSVSITGLADVSGNETEISYEVRMVSLFPIDPASVEITGEALEISVGERAALSAAVVPQWADDISVEWKSGDERVATVDASGLVTAVAPGTCEIYAESVNGRYDVCKITVVQH